MAKYIVPEEITNEQIEKCGFTNYNKPTYYFMQMISSHVSVNISISKKTRKVRIEVLDENILQPIDISRNNDLLKKTDSIISSIVEKGILKAQ